MSMFYCSNYNFRTVGFKNAHGSTFLSISILDLQIIANRRIILALF